MPECTAPASPRPFFQLRDVEFRLWPVLLTAALMQVCLVTGRELARWAFRLGPPSWSEHIGLFVFSATMLQGACGALGIAVMHRLLPRADSHLRWPPGRSRVLLACAIGVAMGLIMLVADYWPDLLQHRAPSTNYAPNPSVAAGWLLAMVTTGLGEETLFRGLLVGLLAALVPGRGRLGSFEISVAGVLVAILFSLAHYASFFSDPLSAAIAQQLYGFIWGLVYVWLMETSRSLLAPIVAHGVGNFVEVGALILLSAK
jgi:uncharacterized protein